MMFQEFYKLFVVNNIAHLCPTGQLTLEYAPRTVGSPSHREDGTPIIYIEEPADDERHTVLGRFMDAWSRLEHSLTIMLSDTLGIVPPLVYPITNSLGTRGLHDVLKMLRPIGLKEVGQTRLMALLDRVKTQNTRRNSIAHGAWVLELRLYDWGGNIGTRRFQYRFYEPSSPEERQALADKQNPKHRDMRAKYMFSIARISSITREIGRLREDIEGFNLGLMGVPEGQRLFAVEFPPHNRA